MTADASLHVLILGATSGIAQATARLYASEKAVIGLAGRGRSRLEAIAQDLVARGASSVEIFEVDFTAAPPAGTLAAATRALGRLDHILLAYGVLGEQATAECDPAVARTIIDVNFGSAALWSLAAADLLARQGRGSLVVLGSVAGDRGRRSNYVYGSAKAGLAVLVQGISHRFAGRGPRAVIVKPGPTDTPMTAGIKKGSPLWATPDAVAEVVRKAADHGGPIVYAPARWRLIMLIIRNIPTLVFNKMNF
ncbi:SDR family NAD(P)-dependent oxidoreductase [Rhodopseudomonas palustris]|uniref:SDR family NAD(P)-dependent oxidoreductase n=1 Tax=Rhodopseudomonas palustris TaxID=1076 RepID=UPI0021F2D7CC|nr:SDR family NAD(P)-dependent oxidoreductase [Rhodopseudomonas palustris]UYO53114.1 SDR family NAD(P)-dependent oxidoreductase [Rhodopseudomonas palustris]